MRVLVVDNNTNYLPQLKKLLSDHFFQVVKYTEVDLVDSDNFDLIILSGGHGLPIQGNEAYFKKEIDLIHTTTKPIFGICFGFELIAHTCGAKLTKLKNKNKGILNIDVVKPDKLFFNIPNFQVYENHRWVIKKVPESLIVLARSSNGIEAIKHKTRFIYAVQFHPEMCVKKTCGDEIFLNFLSLAKSGQIQP